MDQSIQDLLNSLQTLNNNLKYSVYVPSCQKNIDFKYLTTKQFKTVLETLTQNDFNVFNSVFANILKENILDEANNFINTLTLFDLFIIALYTRVYCISEDYTIFFTQEEMDLYNLTQPSITINLKTNIDNKDKTPLQAETIIENSISVLCDIPLQTSETESSIILKKAAFNNEQSQSILGVLFITEIINCIRQITIENNTIIFKDLSYDEKLKIVENLPSTLINKVIKYIEKYKEQFADLFALKVKINNRDGEEVNITKVLEYNGTLFNY